MDEQEQQQQSALPAPQDTSGIDAYRKALEEDMQHQGVIQDPTKEEHPTTTFWNRLIHGAPGKSRISEIGRSIPRGAIGAVKQIQGTLADVGDATNDPIMSLAARAGKKISESVQSVFGKESDDPLASFAEGLTQFILPFALTGPLGAESAAVGVGEHLAPAMNAVGITSRLGVVASSAARGAAVDFSAFDPHSGSITDLLAKIPGDGAFASVAHAASDLLHVKEDDSQAVARLKYAASGIVPAVLIDGLVAGVRGWRATKAGDKAAVESNAKIGKDIVEGTHVPDGAHVKVVPTDDGKFQIVPTGDEKIPDSPKFDNPDAAHAQAETINFAMNERVTAARNAGGLTDSDAQQVRDVFRRMVEAPSPIDLRNIVKGTHFNFSYFNEPHEQLAMIESISEVFEKELNASTKSVPDEKTFAMAREMLGGMNPEQAPALMATVLNSGSARLRDVKLLAADWLLKDTGDKAAKLFDMVSTRPNDPIAWEQARHAVGSLLQLQDALAGARSQEGRTLRSLQLGDQFRKEGNAVLGSSASEKPTFDSPKARALSNKGPKTPALSPVAGMDQRELQTVLRMAKMADGEPRNLFAVGHGAKVIADTGKLSAGLEVFINSLLSSLKVPMTAFTSGVLETNWNVAKKIVGGLGTFNGQLAREGVDIFYGNLAFLGDNFRAGVASLKAGRSIINPVAVHEAIGAAENSGAFAKTAGKIIRSAGRALTAVDEFTRVTNYRSFVRAKSLRVWREKGLTGAALMNQVNADLAAAFDKSTGIATIPAALKYAEGPTLSAPLTGGVGVGLNKLVEQAPGLRAIIPFVRTGINAFNMVLDRTPAINLLMKRNREILQAGGEAAAELTASTAMAGSIMAYGYLRAKAGDLTGRAPKDPGLRELWLKDHQEYSVKIGGRWVSYKRLDPTLTPLGLVADYMMISEEAAKQGKRGADANDIAVGLAASLSRSLMSRTYLQGISDFMSAWSSGDPKEADRWLTNMETAVTAPSLVNYLNDDPYYRETDGLIESTMARYPGLSEKLTARYDVFGEPELRNPSKGIFPTKPAEQTIASDLLSLNKGFAPMERTKENGTIDLTDRAKYGEKGVSPWERMNQLLREPKYGRPSLRDRLEKLVDSEHWKNASPGSVGFPGGERWAMASKIIDSYQQAAYMQTLHEFPKLKDAVRQQRKIQHKAFSEGDEGVEALLRTLGR